jgi:hypothetical protein
VLKYDAGVGDAFNPEIACGNENRSLVLEKKLIEHHIVLKNK